MNREQEAQKVRDEGDCLHDAASVQRAYDRMAQAITAEYAGQNPLLLCVMIGGLVPTAELIQRVTFPFELDYLHATRYRGATSGGGLQWKRQPEQKLDGRHVLVIDDILDEGHTLVAIRRTLAEFIGLQVEDRYVFGCGMDYKEYWRQLPAIYAVKGL